MNCHGVQMLDMVQPKEEGRIHLQDLKSCSLTPIFFDTFINLDKYLEHEQKDPFSGIRVLLTASCFQSCCAVVKCRQEIHSRNPKAVGCSSLACVTVQLSQ